jgi:uncharacterized OB-fold protein
MTVDTPARPLPIPMDWDRGYWQAAAEPRLVVQACGSCGEVRSLPRLMCPTCGSFEFDWPQASGLGTIYSWTVLRRSFHPSFVAMPMFMAVVELDDHPMVHVVSNLVDHEGQLLDPATAAGQIVIGAPVEVAFQDLGEITLPQFRLRANP